MEADRPPRIRSPAVAGTFYPAQPGELHEAVGRYLARAAASTRSDASHPKALIVPHAGYIHSGPVAASAYARLAQAGDTVKRVVLIGPAHYLAIRGVAAIGADAFATPLGEVPVDRGAIAGLGDLPQVAVRDDAHRREHCLEVQLPFLQMVLAQFAIVPLLVGAAGDDEVRQVIDRLWGGPETLILISSDLSHYHDYATARGLDAATAAAIEALAPERIGDQQACGRIPIAGLLLSARARGLRAVTADLRNSGDTVGPHGEVVGYGAFLLA